MKVTEALGLPFGILRVLFDASFAATVGIVSRPAGWTWLQNLRYAMLRSLVKTGVQGLLLIPNKQTIDIYREFMGDRGTKPDVVALASGTVGGWIGKSKAQKVMLYLHGGAYTKPAAPAHLAILSDLVDTASQENKDFAVFALDFGRAPETVYPRQLVRAAVALKYLIEKMGHGLEDIYIAGDSAGANLVAGLLSHMSHPHPNVPRVDMNGDRLGGVFLISPWVTFEQTATSMRQNKSKDWINDSSLGRSSSTFLGGARADNYNTPLMAPAEWWRNLPVHDLCIVIGEYEIFLDDVKAFTKKLQMSNPQTELFIAPAEVHVESTINRAMAIPGTTASEAYFRSWMLKRL